MKVKEWLENLSKADTSTEQDAEIMQGVLHKAGFSKARVVAGVVYMEGKGPPVDIHTVARNILKVVA